jgi:hypothetical protein
LIINHSKNEKKFTNPKAFVKEIFNNILKGGTENNEFYSSFNQTKRIVLK